MFTPLCPSASHRNIAIERQVLTVFHQHRFEKRTHIRHIATHIIAACTYINTVLFCVAKVHIYYILTKKMRLFVAFWSVCCLGWTQTGDCVLKKSGKGEGHRKVRPTVK